METAQSATQSLLETWNSDKGEISKYHGQLCYYKQNELRQQLERLLRNEAEGSLHYFSKGGEEEAKQLLEEYRSNFDWETDYALRVNWEISSAYAEQYVECSSMEEMKAYHNEDKTLEMPDYDEVENDISCDNELTGYNTKNCEVNVSNLRPKQKHQYAVQLVVDCEEAIPEGVFEGLIQSAVVAHIPFTTAEVVSYTANT